VSKSDPIGFGYFCSTLATLFGKCGNERINFNNGYLPNLVSKEFAQFAMAETTTKVGYMATASQQYIVHLEEKRAEECEQRRESMAKRKREAAKAGTYFGSDDTDDDDDDDDDDE
jgi:hypothetical protein